MHGLVWYRALCFGHPIGPWRDDKEKARRDLVAQKLGSYDEWGKFFITVPGDLQVHYGQVQSRAA